MADDVIIPTTYQLLCGVVPKLPKPTRTIIKLTDSTDTSKYEYLRKQEYIQRNSHKPCSKCGVNERHKSPRTGKAYNTLCWTCNKEIMDKRK